MDGKRKVRKDERKEGLMKNDGTKRRYEEKKEGRTDGWKGKKE